MLTWLGGSRCGRVTSAAACVRTAKPQWVCPHYTWADGAPTSSFDLDLHLLTTNNCVLKPVYRKVQNVMGVSRATGVHLLQAQKKWVLCRTKKSLPCHNQQRACELPLGTQKIPNSTQQIPLSSFTAQYSPLGYWQHREPLLMERNSLARIQAAWLRTSVTPVDIWNWSKQDAKQTGIKLLNLANSTASRGTRST